MTDLEINLSKARSLNYLRQLKSSVLFRIGSIGATFVSMPLMLKYLGPERFGIWATMLTLINWITFFDFGINNGLKNKIAECIAKNELKNLKKYIATAYISIGIFSSVCFAIIWVLHRYVPWRSIFNSQNVPDSEILNAVFFLSFFVLLNFFVSVVRQILHANQRTSAVVFGQFLTNVLALLLVAVVYAFAEPSIVLVSFCYGAAIVLANAILTLQLFKRNPEFRPRLSFFDQKKLKDLCALGVKFFIIQLAVLIIFTTDKIIITQFMGPSYVVPYEVIYKLFSIFTLLHGLLIAPLWPAFTDAYGRGDFAWIVHSIKIQIKIFTFMLIGMLLLACMGPHVVKIWVGDVVDVGLLTYLLFALLTALSVWSNIFAYLANATSQLGTQLVSAILAALVNIPLSIMLVSKFDLGLDGVVIASAVSLSFYAVVGPIHSYLLLKSK